MAEAASRSSANTTLIVGTMKAKIGLFPTKANPAKTQEFDTAGPNGGTLHFEQAAQAAPVDAAEEAPDQAVVADPLAADPGSDAPPPAEAPAATNGAKVPGEFERKLIEAGTDQIVGADDIRRGVRLEDGRFIDCTEQVEAIVKRTKLDRIEVVSFIDSTAVRRDQVIGSYYVGAQDDEAAVYLRLFYEGMREKRAAAVVKYTTKSRQNLGVMVATGRDGGVLELLNLVWTEDFREAPAKARAIQKVQVGEHHVSAMMSLIERMHDTPEAIEDLRDDAVALREELRARAEAGEMDVKVVEPLTVPEPEADLEEALQQSLEAVKAGKL